MSVGPSAEPGEQPRSEGSLPMILGLPRHVAAWMTGMSVVAVASALALWGSTPMATTDTLAYQQAAQDLFEQRLFPLRTIGYPALLAITGSQEHLTTALLATQVAMHVAAAWMVVALAQRFRLSRAWSVVLGALLLSPSLMMKAAVGLTEAACEFFLVLTALLFVRWVERRRTPDVVGAGVAIALAALIRPTYQAFGILLAVGVGVWLWRSRRDTRKALASALALAAGTLILVGGVTIFYGMRFGYWGPSPIVGWNLTTKTAPFIEDLSEEEPAKPYLVAWRNEARQADPRSGGLRYIWGHVDELAYELSGRPAGPVSNRQYAAVSAEMLQLNLRLIRHQPVKYLSSVTAAAGSYVLPTPFGIRAVDERPTLQLVWILAHTLVAVLFVSQLFVVGVLMRVDPDPLLRRYGSGLPATWLIGNALILYTALVSISMDTGDPRFRTPTDALILLLVFGGTAVGARSLFSGRANIEPD